MIEVTQENFEEILDKSKEKCEGIINEKDIEFASGMDFEDFTEDIFKNIISNEDTIELDLFSHHGPQKFPDFSLGRFGIEVKLSKKGWESTGNSVYEGNRIDGVEEIYFFFLRQDERKIKVRTYEHCLSDIVVTHSPRYHIDMNQKREESVFSGMDLNYKEFVERSYPTPKLKEYMRERYEGEETWFIDSEEEVISATIKDWSSLDTERKKDLRAEMYALFPREIFSSKFIRPARYLLEQYQIICHNFRDVFTAGGQQNIQINDERKSVPAVYGRLKDYANMIREKLLEFENDVLKDEWNIPEEEEIEPEERWIEILAEYTQKEYAVDIYKSGLTRRMDDYL